MSKVVADITVSLDGFVTGPDAGPAQGLGRGGEPLHTWVMQPDGVDEAVLAEAVDATGAVIMGRRLFDVIDAPDGWTEDMAYGAGHASWPPTLVITGEPPAQVRLADRFTFVVDGVASAVAKAKALANGREVVVMGGGETIRRAIAADLVDELRLHLSPMVLGEGTPLFVGGRPRQWRQTHVRPSANATHLTYRRD